MRNVAMAVGLLTGFSSPVQAATHEVNFDLGVLFNHDETYELFDHDQVMFGLGVSAGVVVWDLDDLLGVHLVGGWSRTWQGATVVVSDGGADELSFETGLVTDEFNLGPKVSISLWDFFSPYVTVQGALLHGQIHIDGDTKEMLRQLDMDKLPNIIVSNTSLVGGAQQQRRR